MDQKPYWQILPSGYFLKEQADGNLYITVDGGFIVTEATGQPRYFRGTDEQTIIRAKKWAWSFYDGNQPKYRKE